VTGRRAILLPRVLLALAGLGAAQLVLAPPARALPGLTVVSASQAGGLVPLTVTASCPAGTVAVGGSYEVESWTDTAVVTDFQPLPGLAGYRATGNPPTSSKWATTADPWRVTAYAECGDSGVLQPAARTAGITTLTTVRASVDSSTSQLKRITATCPAGASVLGTGAVIGSGRGLVLLESVVPDQTTVTVSARARPGTSPRWSLTAVAICADPGPDAVFASASTGTGPGTKTVTVTCPAGTFVHGAGMRVQGGAGAVLVSTLAPGGGNPPTTMTVIAREAEDPPPPWAVQVIAVCLR
jgi:hypothetical protein